MITNKKRLRESSVIMSSATPSEKYCCCGLSLMLTNGSTAIDGMTGSVTANAGGGASSVSAVTCGPVAGTVNR